MPTKRCTRCGGTGRYSKGTVINGVCFGCGGDGQYRPRVVASRLSRRVVQYALVDAAGRHLAINTDQAVLEGLRASLPSAVGITTL